MVEIGVTAPAWSVSVDVTSTSSDTVPHISLRSPHACDWIRRLALTSSASQGEDTQPTTPAAPEALAGRVLAYEAGQQTSPEAFAAAGERAYLQLRERLALVLGSTGFDALWTRAMHLAQPTFRPGDDTAAVDESFPTPASRADGLHAAVRGRDPAAVQHNLVVAFASFISLLFTFIGEELSLHFIRQLWPDLPPDAAASHAEEATP
jgi:hypothetical protein